MGLQRYKTKELFLHLFYPTILVIMTVIQMQIFHKKYIAAMTFATNNPRHFVYAYYGTPQIPWNYYKLFPVSSTFHPCSSQTMPLPKWRKPGLRQKPFDCPPEAFRPSCIA